MYGFFDEEIKRNKKDKIENFDNAFMMLEEAVTGKSIFDTIDKNDVAKGAIGLLCKFYKIHINDESYPPDIETFEQRLEYRLKPSGIKYRTVTLRQDWYKNAVCPILAKIKESDDVILLLPNNFNRYYYYDLKTGSKCRLNSKVISSLETEAYYFYQPLPLKKLTNGALIKYAFSLLNGWDIFCVVLSGLIITVFGMIVPKMSQLLLSEIIKNKDLNIFIGFSIMIVGITISCVLFKLFKMIVLDKLIRKVSNSIKASAMMRILSLKPSFFKEYSSGDVAYRLNLFGELIDNLFTTIFNGLLMFIFSFLYFFTISTISSSLLTPALIISLVIIIFTVIFTILRTKNNRIIMEERAKENALTYNILSGVEKIKLTGSEERAFNRWAKQESRASRATFSPNICLKLSTSIILGLNLIGGVLIYIVAKNSGVSVAGYYAFTAAYGLVSGAIADVGNLASDFALLKPTFKMIKPILEAEVEVNGTKKIVNRITGGVELSNISFKYEDGQQNIINNLSLSIRSGEYVAIVGRSGCGKSTLIRLLLGFETPNKGSIYYSGQDMTKLDLESLRKCIGVVTQDGKLINSDIFHNIIASNPSLTMEDAWRAADIAGLSDFINELPMGMQTIISEDGGGISGGQKQRLLIARAVASKPKLLIFDEATSALDNVSQKQVSEALDSLTCTRIVIAHRLSTIKNCNRIFVLDKGNIIESGKYNDLINKNGYFAELVKNQRLDIENE